MAKAFEIPDFYRAELVTKIKSRRQTEDNRKKDLSASIIRSGEVSILLARHFGFCYGVQNAIEIAYKALAENPGKRIFLLSEMIHNPQVNADLISRGIQFLQTTEGKPLRSMDELTQEDIVIVPAFGTTVELFSELEKRGINPQAYNATCPFVEKVWKRAAQLGTQGFSIIIHGKHSHEETRATFSHSRVNAPSLVIRDLAEAEILANYILGTLSVAEIEKQFRSRMSDGFVIERDLAKIGVVNQTTMLAEETQAISECLKRAYLTRYGAADGALRFADTRDTLCYATSENQQAVAALIEEKGDLAIVVGGYNSSNTSHLVEMMHMRGIHAVYYIKDETEIVSSDLIRSLDLATTTVKEYTSWLPTKRPLKILMSAGASCPDAIVDRVIKRIFLVLGISPDQINF